LLNRITSYRPYYKNIFFEPIAISKIVGNITFSIPVTYGNKTGLNPELAHIANVKGEDNGRNGTKLIVVAVNTLNNLKTKYNIEHVDLLKVDTEGYDSWVLEGASELLPFTDIIIYECHLYMYRAGATFFETQLYLDNLGFDVFKIGVKQFLKFNGEYYHPYYDIKRQWENCIAISRQYPRYKDIISKFNLNFTHCFLK